MAFQRAEAPEGTAVPLGRRTTYSYKRSACHGGRQHQHQRGMAGLAELARTWRIPESDGWLLPCSRARGAAEPWPHSRQSYSSSISKNKMQMQNKILVRAPWKAAGEILVAGRSGSAGRKRSALVCCPCTPQLLCLCNCS